MNVNKLFAEVDALTTAGPNLPAVQLQASLRGISFQQAMINSVREWITALDEVIECYATEAARNIGHAETLSATPAQRRAWHFEAAGILATIDQLSERRIVAATMLAGVEDNPIDTRPHTTS